MGSRPWKRGVMALNDDLFQFGNALRSEILEWIRYLETLPSQDDPRAESIIIWMRTLCATIWDTSESVLHLLVAERNHLRAVKILNRSLFEYALKLKYFSYCPDEATSSLKQVRIHLGRMTNATPQNFSPEMMSAENRKTYDDLLAASREKFTFAKITANIKVVLEKEGRAAEIPALLDNYYAAASGFVHGSETLILDVWRQHGGHKDTIELKSQRLYTVAAFDETIRSLLETLQGISVHLKHDHHSAWYATYRDDFQPRIFEEMRDQDRRMRQGVIDRGPVQHYDW
jgi:hypothetical protein